MQDKLIHIFINLYPQKYCQQKDMYQHIILYHCFDQNNNPKDKCVRMKRVCLHLEHKNLDHKDIFIHMSKLNYR